MSISNFGLQVVVGTGPRGPAGPTGSGSGIKAILATTANITLSGEQTIDGVLTSATTVLVKNQTDQKQNGVYLSSSSTWTRISEFSTWSQMTGTLVTVVGGNTQDGTVWLCDIPATGTVGTDNITFVQVGSGSGSGTVTSVSVTTANGVSGTVTNPTTTPAISLTLGAITPSSVAASGSVTGSNLSGTNTGDQTITLTGDVTGTGTGSFAATIANKAVTYAKIQDVSATDKLLGRSTSGSGIVEEITCTQAGRNILDDADASAQRTTLGLGTSAVLDSSTDVNLSPNSDSLLPTQKAVKTYVDSAVTGLWDFKGSTDCSTNPNYPAASKGDAYVVSVAGKIGGASGPSVDVGDVFVAVADNAGGTQAAVGSSWIILEHNLQGALLAANNLSDLASVATAVANLGLTIGTNTQAFSSLLTNLAALATNGILVKTAAGTTATRTIAGTTDRIAVTNGDGVSGNPTADIASTYAGQTSITTLGTIVTGIWNGTAIPVLYGGTGATTAATAFSNLGGNAIGKLSVIQSGFLITFNGQGAPIVAGSTTQDLGIVPFDMIITGWEIFSDVAGSITVDIWKSSYASYPPVVGGSITGSEKPTLSATDKNRNLAVSTWATSLTAGDALIANVDSTSTVTKVVIMVFATRVQ